MELSFQVSLAGVKISDFGSAATHAKALAKYSSDVEKNNLLEDGTFKDAIIAGIPFSPCFCNKSVLFLFLTVFVEC
jgi:hypothetical protein